MLKWDILQYKVISDLNKVGRPLIGKQGRDGMPCKVKLPRQLLPKIILGNDSKLPQDLMYKSYSEHPETFSSPSNDHWSPPSISKCWIDVSQCSIDIVVLNLQQPYI